MPDAPPALAPLTVLVQGGIASGKSTVTRLLAQRGAEFLDCDRMAHEELRRPEVVRAVQEAFGAGVMDPARGEVDRARLAEVVFRDPAALSRLEALIHPRVATRVRQELERAAVPAGTPRRVVVIDAAVAAKMKMVERYDLTVFVAVSEAKRLERAAATRGWSREELLRREAQQGPLAERERSADFVVPNEGDLSEAESHVERFWTQFVEPRR